MVLLKFSSWYIFFVNSKSHVGGEEEIFLMTFWLMNFFKKSYSHFQFFIFGFPQLVVSISLKVLKISEASFSVRVTSGERETDVYRTVEQYPIFVKAGAIVPMEGFEGGNSLGRKTALKKPIIKLRPIIKARQAVMPQQIIKAQQIIKIKPTAAAQPIAKQPPMTAAQPIIRIRIPEIKSRSRQAV